VAQAFKTFLMSDGGALIEQTIGYRPKEALKKSPAARHQPGLGGLRR
jgi:hypothetical protein